MDTIKIKVKGGRLDGEVFDIPKDLSIPEISDSMNENEINLLFLEKGLEKLEPLIKALRENPLIELEEIEPKKPWEH